MSEPQAASVPVRLLKSDGMGRVERLDGPWGTLVRRVACGGRVPLSGVLARVLLGRERRALRALEGVPGVARLVEDDALAAAPGVDGRVPARRAVLLRTWAEGLPLYAAQALPRDFFERLEELVRALHARGVCHNDLHKENNVIVGRDGYPHLVDFELASVHARRGRTFAVRSREDLRHVAKHRRRYETRGAGGRVEAGGRRSPLAWAWMRLGKPLYTLVVRRVLRRPRSEPRRAKDGAWPEWTEPCGPRT